MSHRVFIYLGIAAVAAVAVIGWAVLGHRSAAPSPQLQARLDVASDRMQKTDLIQRLTTPPQVVVLGGSRALRFDPTYVQQRTGLTAFNAAVTGARPEDAWALVSLLHQRFPTARFRFLWIIHADEFDPKSLDPGLVYDPTLVKFFPAALITPQLRLAAAHLKIDPLQRSRVFAPNGYALHDRFDQLFPRPGADAIGVRNNIRQALMIYARTKLRLSSRSVLYFGKTLALMDSIASAPPVIVSAPVDPRILAATASHGWSARQRLLQQFLVGLHRRYQFVFIDLSKASLSGLTASDFYDGIHLRVTGADKVVATLLGKYPGAFGVPARPAPATTSVTQR